MTNSDEKSTTKLDEFDLEHTRLRDELAAGAALREGQRITSFVTFAVIETDGEEQLGASMLSSERDRREVAGLFATAYKIMSE